MEVVLHLETDFETLNTSLRKFGSLVAQGLDVPNSLKNVPNFLKNVPNFLKNVPNFLKDIFKVSKSISR